MGRGATINLYCKEDIPAKIIIIQIATNTENEILTLCEVEVYGSKLKFLLTFVFFPLGQIAQCNDWTLDT